MKNTIITELIKLMEDNNIKVILENESPREEANIVEQILNFNEQQKGRGLRTLTPEQTLQRLPITLAQLKAVNKFEKLLNEICLIIYSLYQAKEITKKVYEFNKAMKQNHCVKSVQIQIFFWSLSFRIWTEYGDLKSSYSVQMR